MRCQVSWSETRDSSSPKPPRYPEPQQCRLCLYTAGTTRAPHFTAGFIWTFKSKFQTAELASRLWPHKIKFAVGESDEKKSCALPRQLGELQSWRPFNTSTIKWVCTIKWVKTIGWVDRGAQWTFYNRAAGILGAHLIIVKHFKPILSLLSKYSQFCQLINL